MTGRHSRAARPDLGIGWRPELAGDLLASPSAVDFLELTAEGCTSKEALRESRAVAEVWPVAVHGIKASLGSAEGLDLARTQHLARLARELRATCVSEHIAFVRAGGLEIGHLTGLPFNREALEVTARNVARAQRLLPDVPLFLENVAWAFRWKEDEMHEGDFHVEVVARTGCKLLLDVGNLYANAINAGCDPSAYAERYPLERVGMIHVAGGIFEDGFYFDTHAHPVPDAVFELVTKVLARAGDVPVVLERDGAFPSFRETRRELERLAGIDVGAAPVERPALRREGEEEPDMAGMAAAQSALARALTGAEAPADATYDRARSILVRKRAEEALRLLPRLAALGEEGRALALRSVRDRARPPSKVAIHDALHVAHLAEDDAALREIARADAAPLRARFVLEGESVRPRTMPFVGRIRTRRGVQWIVKGPGAEARVRILESGRGS